MAAVLQLFPVFAPPARPSLRAVCRSAGCGAEAELLGYCATCHAAYGLRVARRAMVAEALRLHLTRDEDPTFCAFGPRHGTELAAHVLAHLELAEVRRVHVPEDAVRDYVSELDERADEESLRGR